LKNKKTNFKLIIWGIIAVIYLSGCASYPPSNKYKNEKLTAVLKKDTVAVINNTKLYASRRGLSAPVDIGSRLINYAAIGVEKLITLSKKNLTVEYSTGINNLYFYNKTSKLGMFDPDGMQFKGFSIKRNIDINKKQKDVKALYLSFSVDTTNKYEILDNSIFRLKLQDIELNYAKARIPGFKWYMPWTVFWAGKKNKKLNMDVDITITSSWIDKNFNIHRNVEIGNFKLCLRDMPLDIKDTSYTRYYHNLRKGDTYLSGFSFIVPRSFSYIENGNELWGQGFYSIQVNIKEAGKEKFITKVAVNSTPFIKEAKSILDEMNDFHK